MKPADVTPLRTLLIVKKYRRPNFIGSIAVPGIWAQDNSRMAWEVVKSTPKANEHAGFALQPDWIVITPPNHGVYVPDIELPEIEVIDMEGKTTHERPGAWLIDAKDIVQVYPWTEEEEDG